MTAVPDGLPTLSRGAHQKEDGEACVMEYVSVLTGASFSDFPPCTDEVIARVAQGLNDMITDRHRHKLVGYIDRLASAGPTEKPFYDRLEDLLVEKYGYSREMIWLGGIMQAAHDQIGNILWGHGQHGLTDDDELVERGFAFLDELLDLHHKITNVEVKVIPPEALADAKRLIETRALVV